MALDIRQRLGVFALATGLVALGACQPDSQGQGETAPSDPWLAVQTYIDVDAEWHAEGTRIARSDMSLEAKAEAREALGPHPDIADAVAAARLLVGMPEAARRADAAAFLMEHPLGLSKTADADMALGAEVLSAEIGPDWSVVEDYERAFADWSVIDEEPPEAEPEPEESAAPPVARGRPPSIVRAAAAALAIIDDDQGDVVRAAEFLINETMPMPGRESFVLRAARTLADRVPDYGHWPETLQALDAGRFRANDEIDAFLEDLAASIDDPVARATARYYLASGLVRSANAAAQAADDANPGNLRERALAAATGLSDSIAEERFVARLKAGDDDTAFGTFAEAEAALVYRIEHATVGGTLPEIAGTTLDGSEENLADYAGNVVLIDFWATWCGPCIAALPELREVVDEQPSDRFELLSICVDEDLDDVVEFQAGEPMPWANWHVGVGSEIARTWDVRAFPTYILADEEGTILARTSDLDEALAAVDEAMGT